MERLTSIIRRGLYVLALILAGAAVLEKFANHFGYIIFKTYAPWRLFEFAVIVILFLIPLQLWEIKLAVGEIKEMTRKKQ